ncbi:FliH/SctL family protein [uncultured Acetatifactor sp.]|uniref:FliH/SctL family protein n=1 Tax=uncultured Acetatifactor sp. TaxID=1671927 RepID=UPI0026027EF5|nr:FliH/SctL family protein [uncultured Acetatifactor sp.]
MSSNLVKQFFMTLPEDKEKLVIDNNDRIRRRLEELSRGEGNPEGGFVSGLAIADVIETPEDATGNVIKAQDEAKELLEQSRAEAEELRAQAQAEAERILEEARAQAQAEKQQVLEQAKQQGYMEGMSRAQAHEGAMEQEYQEKARLLEEEYEQQIEMLEPNLVEAITGIYEHIFHVELSSYREILTGLISDVLHKLDGSRSFIIHVSKDDYAYVNMQKKQMLTGAVSESVSVDVVEDATVGRNECMIETENGIFDCGLGTQLSELKKRLRLLAWSREE